MKLILFILILIFVMVFAIQNDSDVTIKFFQLMIENVRLYNVILFTFLIGFIGGVISKTLHKALKNKGEIKKQ